MHATPVKPLDVLRDAGRRAAVLEHPSDRRFLAVAHLRERHAFPLRVTTRGLVTGTRSCPEPLVEVLPEGYGLRALTTLGPLLVPTDRRLAPGSVVRVEVDLVDPARYAVQPAGLLARAVRFDVEVAVEQ